MLGRKLKERKEYVKQKETERDTGDKKEELKAILKANTRIPHHLRGDAKQLLDEIIYETVEEEVVHPFPRVAVTTSHMPSSQLKSFAKHISLVFNGIHVMRGKMSESELSEYSRRQEITHLLIFREHKGNPSSMVLCKYPHGPTYHFSIFNVKYQRRQKALGEKAYLVLDGMDSDIGKKLTESLALCFPKTEEASRVVSFINRNGTVAFRHFYLENRKLIKECEFDMKLFKVVNSTIDTNGDVDFALKAFMNSTNNDILKRKEVTD
ncbi:snoRNA-binding rRNA-processing protein imp4 [Glugoides intestinalis]